MRNFLDKLRGSLRSATVWINSGLLAMLPFYEDIKGSMTELQPYLPDNIYKWMGVAVVVLNIVMRFRTRVPLEHK